MTDGNEMIRNDPKVTVTLRCTRCRTWEAFTATTEDALVAKMAAAGWTPGSEYIGPAAIAGLCPGCTAATKDDARLEEMHFVAIPVATVHPMRGIFAASVNADPSPIRQEHTPLSSSERAASRASSTAIGAPFSFRSDEDNWPDTSGAVSFVPHVRADN